MANNQNLDPEDIMNSQAGTIYDFPDQVGGQRIIPKSQEKPDVFIQMLDTDFIIEQLEQNLLGRVWDNGDKIWVQKYEASVTKEFINTIMPYLRIHASKIFPLTNYSKNEVNDLMKEVVDTIVNTICIEYAKFFPGSTQQKQFTNLSITIDKIEHTISALYNRSLGNKERDMYNKIVSQNINEVQYAQNRPATTSGGFASRLPFIGGQRE